MPARPPKQRAQPAMVQMLDDISKRKGRDAGDDDLLLLSDADEQVRHVF